MKRKVGIHFYHFPHRGSYMVNKIYWLFYFMIVKRNIIIVKFLWVFICTSMYSILFPRKCKITYFIIHQNVSIFFMSLFQDISFSREVSEKVLEKSHPLSLCDTHTQHCPCRYSNMWRAHRKTLLSPVSNSSFGLISPSQT